MDNARSKWKRSTGELVELILIPDFNHAMRLSVLTLLALIFVSTTGCQTGPKVLPSEFQSTSTSTSTSTNSPDANTETASATGPQSTAAEIGATPSAARPTPQGTPAGEGVLTDQVGDPIEFFTGEFIPLGYAWYERTNRGYILVYAGEDAHDPQQGVVTVMRSGTIWDPIGSRHETVMKSGGLLIVDVKSERLILRSTSGSTFYFDVPAGRFVDSLTEIVPTMTPGPTITPQPTIRKLVLDDAPDEPIQAVIDEPFNTPLQFFIDPEGDEDWHVFRLRKQADLVFSLFALPEPFGIEVYSQTNFVKLGGNDTPNTEDKSIRIPQAAEGYYLVRVWGINGAWSPDTPYTLLVTQD